MSESEQTVNSSPEVVSKETKVSERSIRLIKDVISAFRLHLPDTSQSETIQAVDVLPSIPVQKTKQQLFLKFLLAFPYLLMAGFVVARFWDFNGVIITIASKSVALEGLLTTLTVSGLIGFATNWLAITMLFQPRKPRPVLGYGLIPAQKERIAYRLAHAVTKDLINPDLIRKKVEESQIIKKYREKALLTSHDVLSNPQFRQDIKQLVVSYAEDVMSNPEVRSQLARQILDRLEDGVQDKQLEKVALKVYRFVKGDDAQHIIENALAKLPKSVEQALDKLDGFLDTLPEKLEEQSIRIEELAIETIYSMSQQLDIKGMIENNLNKFDEHQLERLLKSTTNEQLKYIQYLGAVLGTIGGFIIWAPIPSLLVLVGLAGFIVLLDIALYRLKHG